MMEALSIFLTPASPKKTPDKILKYSRHGFYFMFNKNPLFNTSDQRLTVILCIGLCKQYNRRRDIRVLELLKVIKMVPIENDNRMQMKQVSIRA